MNWSQKQLSSVDSMCFEFDNERKSVTLKTPKKRTGMNKDTFTFVIARSLNVTHLPDLLPANFSFSHTRANVRVSLFLSVGGDQNFRPKLNVQSIDVKIFVVKSKLLPGKREGKRSISMNFALNLNFARKNY